MPSESVAVKVVAKCRALSEDEKNQGSRNVVSVSGSSVTVQAAGKEQSFSFDQVYGADVPANTIFSECCESLVQRAVAGYNVTVLAYGTNASGKSQLMAGSDDMPGIVPQMSESIFAQLQQSGKEAFVTASFVEIHGEEMTDLLNPHSRSMTVRNHDKLGVHVSGLSELVAHTEEELSRLYLQGVRARRMGATQLNAHKARSSGIFTVTIQQRENAASKVGLRSKVTLADLAGTEPSSKDGDAKSVNGVSAVLAGLRKGGGGVSGGEGVVPQLLQLGNAMLLVLLCVSPRDSLAADTMHTLQQAASARGAKAKLNTNLEETENVISELREEIARLRTKLSKNPHNKEDIVKMEELLADLQLAKKQTWEEKERMSCRYEEERKSNLADKGMLGYVLEAGTRGGGGGSGQNERIVELQREKDRLTLEYRDKRKKVDDLKDDLQKKISEYSRIAHSGKAKESETRRRVAGIHELKGGLAGEKQALADIKQRLRDAQDAQRHEKDVASGNALDKASAEMRHMAQGEERRRQEKENRAMLAEELERLKMEAEHEKAEIQLRGGGAEEEVVRLELAAVDARVEKAVTTLHVQQLQQEKAVADAHLHDNYQRHKHELEIQQLQHFQGFREYRGVYEQQRGVLEQRYRALVEDAVQDAIFLASRNDMLQHDNDSLRQQIAELKDQLSMGGEKGRKGKA